MIAKLERTLKQGPATEPHKQCEQQQTMNQQQQQNYRLRRGSSLSHSVCVWGGGGGALTLKAPITTAADDKFCDIFPNFRIK